MDVDGHGAIGISAFLSFVELGSGHISLVSATSCFVRWCFPNFAWRPAQRFALLFLRDLVASGVKSQKKFDGSKAFGASLVSFGL